MPVPAQQPQLLTARERRVVWCHRACWFLWEGQFGVNKAVRTAKWLLLVQGDAGRFAQCMGLIWSLNSLCNLFINPIMGALSDSFSRRPIIAATRVGLTVYFWGGLLARSVPQMIAVEVLAWGVLSAGGLAVQAASLDDMFGERPELNSVIQSQNAAFAGVSGCLGPLLGILCHERGWARLSYFLPCASLVLQALLFLAAPETLLPAKRRPFKLAGANPLSNCALLLRNGSSLRRLTAASMLYHACTSTWGTQEAYRTQALGWGPTDILKMDSGFFLTSALSTSLVVPRLIARWGNRRLVERWSWVAGIAYLGCGNAWRPLGCSTARSSTQYVLSAVALQDPWTDPCSFATRALVIHAGTSRLSCGQGQLSAAYDGLTDIVNVVMPSVWGALFARFASAERGSVLAAIGIGGHYVLAALFRIMSGLLVRSLPHTEAIDRDD